MSDKTMAWDDSFFAELGNPVELLGVFEHLPDVHFFVKDMQSNVVAANQSFARRMGFEDSADVIGKSTWELCPRELAELYVADDRQVMDSQKKMVDIVELNQFAGGPVNWFITSKFPLHRKDGSVAGLVGVARDIKQARGAFEPFDRFTAVIEYIADHYGERITVPRLANMAGMSRSSFERQFKRLCQLSPAQYILKYRIQKVCQELTGSDKPIAEIADETGFYDQSAMTHHFTLRLGITPRAYRKKSRRG